MPHLHREKYVILQELIHKINHCNSRKQKKVQHSLAHTHTYKLWENIKAIKNCQRPWCQDHPYLLTVFCLSVWLASVEVTSTASSIFSAQRIWFRQCKIYCHQLQKAGLWHRGTTSPGILTHRMNDKHALREWLYTLAKKRKTGRETTIPRGRISYWINEDMSAIISHVHLRNNKEPSGSRTHGSNV